MRRKFGKVFERVNDLLGVLHLTTIDGYPVLSRDSVQIMQHLQPPNQGACRTDEKTKDNGYDKNRGASGPLQQQKRTSDHCGDDRNDKNKIEDTHDLTRRSSATAGGGELRCEF